MKSEKRGLAGGGVVLRFERRATAEMRIAGVAAAARAASAACAAGAGEIRLVLEDGWASPALSDDLERACLDVPVVSPLEADPPRIALTLFCDTHLLTAQGLLRFMAADAATLACGPVQLAAKTGTGFPGPSLQAGPGDTLDLRRPAAAAREILKGTSKASDGIVSRLLNRPVSQRISALLLRIAWIRPHHLTVVTAALGLIMFLAFLSGGKTGLVLGGLLFHVASVVDGVDGEIARATFRDSRRGAIMDTAVDMATNLLFYLGVTISLTRLYGPDHALAGGWCVLLGLIGILIIRRLAAKAGDPGSFDILKNHYRARYPDGMPARIVEALVAITSRDFFAFGNALIILAGGGAAVSYLLAGFTTLWVALILIAAPAILREAEALPEPSPMSLTPAE